MSDRLPAPTSARSGIIDLWRALACIAVVAYHARCNYFGPDLHPSVALLNRFAEYGYLGVSVFFVLSGYCLAEAIETRIRRGETGIVPFWQDRFLRIFPAYWAALALGILLSLAALPFNGLPLSSVSPPGPLPWLANLALATEWVRIPPLLGVSWSLDYEIGFYILVGLALLSPRANTTCRLSCYALITATAHLPGVAGHIALLSLWPAFACGIAVRFALDPTLPRVIRLGMPAYPLLLIAFSSGDRLAPPIFAIALLLLLASEKRLPSPPRPLLLLGAASYSVYLAHVPLMSPAANLARRFVPPSSLAYLAVWWVQIVVGIAGGILFFTLVERRCEKLRVRLRLHRPQ